MTTPQTRDDGLSAEELARFRQLAETVRGQGVVLEVDPVLHKLIAHIDYLESSLLSHKQQGRNEGLEEAAKVYEAAYNSARDVLKDALNVLRRHEYSVAWTLERNRCEERIARALKRTPEKTKDNSDSALSVSPLEKP